MPREQGLNARPLDPDAPAVDEPDPRKPFAAASFKYSSTTDRTSPGAKAWRSSESSIGRLTGSGSSITPLNPDGG